MVGAAGGRAPLGMRQLNGVYTQRLNRRQGRARNSLRLSGIERPSPARGGHFFGASAYYASIHWDKVLNGW